MTKKKKGMSVQTKMQPKVPNGRVTKAKHRDLPPMTPSTRKLQVKLHKTPLTLQQSPVLAKDAPLTTPFLKKCLPCTSTPLNAGGESYENNILRDFNSGRRQILTNTDDAQSRTPLSPVLGDISNVISTKASRKTNLSLRKNVGKPSDESTKRTRKENGIEPSSPVRKIIKLNEESGAIDAGKQLIKTNRRLSTRRKSVGVRRVSLAPVTNEVQQESKKPDTNNRVTVVNKSPINTKRNCRRRSPESVPDQSLIKRLRQDWSSTTFEETPAQLQRIRSEKNPRLIAKRILSPLIEISTYESTIPAFKQQTVPVIEEEEREYSSSAEFESDDDKENSRSKRAPTWKDLSKKTLKQPLSHSTTRLSRVKIHRLPNHYMMPNPTLNEADLSVSMDKSSMVPKANQNKKEESSKSLEKMPSQETTQQKSESNKESPNKTVARETITTASRSPNLLNKSDLIEEILSSSTEKDNETAVSSKTKMSSPKKFFHNRGEDKSVSVENIEQPKSKRRSRKSEKPNTIYEFLSQSSQSDTNDPAADIIQKMISTGKVTVAKHKKGTGKPVVPRQRCKAATKTNLPKSNNVIVKPKVIAKPKVKSPQENVVEDASPFDIDFDDGDDISTEEPARDQRGFSDLARSAMMKQARHTKTTQQRKVITDKKQLLAMAQKFVAQSTPVRSLTSPNAQLSPIPNGGSTPWRVNDDKLPQTFYFNRNSANLPSFSSDYIPLTPVKNKSKSTSSFSSNDSNAENIAPPKVNGKHSNPRRALSYRSPLKAINILEIVNLPSLAMDKTTQKESDKRESKENTTSNKSRRSNKSEKANNEPPGNTNTHGFDDMTDNLGESEENKQQSKSVGATNANMFGFEEMIEDDEDEHGIESTDQLALTGKHHLKEQMQRLRRLRDRIPSPIVTPSTRNPIKSVFDGDKQQKTIKQMLCSTMIEKDNCAVETAGSLNKRPQLNETDCSDLFRDPDPETTFDQSVARRSYTRPFQRKRKLRHNFVMFMDSDASEEEEEDIPAPKHYKKKTKDRQKTIKENAEMKNFVNEFNEMCKEVSEYELIVE